MKQKGRVISLSVLIFFYTNLAAQDIRTSDSNTTEADRAYAELFALKTTEYGVTKDTVLTVQHIIARNEKKYMRFRNVGMDLWQRFPNDPRKYVWFNETYLVGPTSEYLHYHYWKNIDSAARSYTAKPQFTSYSAPVNFTEYKRHEYLYSIMRKDFLKYLDSSCNDEEKKQNTRIGLYCYELASFLKLSRNAEFRKGKKLDLNKLIKLFTASADPLKLIDWNGPVGRAKFKNTLQRMDNDFVSCYTEYGLNMDDMMLFIKALEKDANPGIQEWAIQRKALFMLKKNPLQFNCEAIDGRKIDINRMKGKVVLLDFWNIHCSSCIARMPAIKVIYDKYKSAGFEVVSLCLNNSDKLDIVKKIEHKIDAGWPTVLIGSTDGSLGHQICRKYGFKSVPQLLLLDKEGKLVMLNDKLRNGDFEPLIKELLNNNSTYQL